MKLLAAADAMPDQLYQRGKNAGFADGSSDPQAEMSIAEDDLSLDVVGWAVSDVRVCKAVVAPLSVLAVPVGSVSCQVFQACPSLVRSGCRPYRE